MVEGQWKVYAIYKEWKQENAIKEKHPEVKRQARRGVYQYKFENKQNTMGLVKELF